MKKSSSAFVAGVLVAGLMVISMVVFAAAQSAPKSGANAPAAQGATTSSNQAAAAQASPTSSADAAQPAADKGVGLDVTPYYNLYLQRLATALGVSQDKLNSSMNQALNDSLTQAVHDGKLTQQQATEASSQWANMQIKLFGAMFMAGNKDGGDKLGGIMGQVTEQMYQAVAAKLGMTMDQLKQALGSGQTIAQIAASKGVSEQALKDAVVAAIKPTLDQAVKDGKITEAEEDSFIQSVRNTDLSKVNFDGVSNPQESAMKTLSRQIADVALQAAANKLGMPVDQLWGDINASIGRTFGDVVAEKNANAAEIKTAVVNAVKPDLDHAVQGNTLTQAEETSIIQGIQNDDFSKPFDQFGLDDASSGLARQVMEQIFKATESKLHITAAQLDDQLQQGKSLADMAQSANVSVADLKAAIVSSVQSALNTAVAGGKVTQDFANRAIQSIQNADLTQNPKLMLAGIFAPPNKQVKP